MENDNKLNLRQGSIKEHLKSRNFLRPFLGILIGGIGGFFYYYFIGCKTGSCPITSNSYSAVIIGGLMGYLITGILFTKS
jgi:hypothetical protein